MSVEEQLRTGFAALTADPPPAGDRVAAVEGRVRRRARRRATGAVVLTAVACLGVAGLTVLPTPVAERATVAAEAPPVTARDLLRPMVAVRVDLGLPDAQRDAVVDRELQALQPPADNVSRDVGEVREVLFTDGIDADRLDAFVNGVQGEAVRPATTVLQVDGSAVELTARLSPALQRELGDRFPDVLPELRDTLRVYGLSRPADSADVTLEYQAWALDQRTLDRVVGLFARSVGADPEDVRVRALPAD